MAAYLPNLEPLLQFGIDPKTGLPMKAVSSGESGQKEAIKRLLRLQDEQQFIHRYQWYNLPDGIDGELLERILYYRGQGMFFYMPANTTFYFLPYALYSPDKSTGIDVYGRYTGVTPVPFNGTASAGKNGKEEPWIIGLSRKPVYSIKLDEIDEKFFTESCVLLSDYSKQMSQTTLPRQSLNEPVLDIEAEFIPFMTTALMNETGVTAMRVNNQDEYSNVAELNKTVKNAALTGKRFLPTIGNVEFQELAASQLGNAADFMQAMESVDNFRLSTMGIDSNGLFQKKSHMLGVEQAQAGGASGFILDDGLYQRQRFCDIVNSIWGLGIYCELSENATGDVDMNGAVADEQDQSGQEGGVQPNELSE